jgi:glycosyltransferase involved in cell wall biosynthesis
MTATEAMCYGIPVICTETPGLKENCDKAGIYIKNRDDIKEWVNAICKLDEEKNYKAASRKAYIRAKEQTSNDELETFEQWMREMVYKYN